MYYVVMLDNAIEFVDAAVQKLPPVEHAGLINSLHKNFELLHTFNRNSGMAVDATDQEVDVSIQSYMDSIPVLRPNVKTACMVTRYTAEEIDDPTTTTIAFYYTPVKEEFTYDRMMSIVTPGEFPDEPTPACIVELNDDNSIQLTISASEQSRFDRILRGKDESGFKRVLQELGISDTLFKTISETGEVQVLQRNNRTNKPELMTFNIQLETYPDVTKNVDALLGNLYKRLKIRNAGVDHDRRNFFKKAAIAGGVVTSYMAGTQLGVMRRSQPMETVDNLLSSLEKEEQRMIEEIQDIRKGFNLSPTPAELEYALQNPRETDVQKEFQSDLPEFNKASGMAAEHIAKTLFGDSGSKTLLHRATTDEFLPDYIAFNFNNRTLTVSAEFPNFTEEKIINTLLHEVGGHGSDPKIGLTIYNRSQLIRAEYGKWNALSQAYAVQEQFFNHPNDLTLPLLKRSLGEVVGNTINQDTKAQLSDPSGIQLIEKLVNQLAQKKNIPPKDLVFNKQVCMDIGEEIVSHIRNKTLDIHGQLKTVYQDILEGALTEQWAEMERISILNPDLIDHSTTIIEGVETVLSAIQGKPVNLTKLRDEVSDTKIYADRLSDERELRPACENNTLDTFQPRSEMDKFKAAAALTEFKQKEDQFTAFVTNGTIPDTISAKQKALLTRYSEASKEIVAIHTTLRNTTNQKFDANFDPEIDINEIREIEHSIDSAFIRRILFTPDIDQETTSTIEHHIGVLRKYIASHRTPSLATLPSP